MFGAVGLRAVEVRFGFREAVAGMLLWGGWGIGSALAQMPPPSTPPTQVPLDGGIILLAAAGAAYGAKKVYAKGKKANK